MRPTEVLMHLRNAWLQEPQRELTLTLCHACREALLDDLDSRFVPVKGPMRRQLEHSEVMGFTFSDGHPDACALHPFWLDALPRLKSRDSQDRSLTPEAE